MTERQKRFVDFYIQTANASESARRAGYSERSASSIGERLLRNVEVSKTISEKLTQLGDQRVASTQEILEHLTDVIRGKVTEQISTNSGKVVTVSVSEVDRLHAADMLLKVQGAYKERVDVQVSGAALLVQTLQKISVNVEN